VTTSTLLSRPKKAFTLLELIVVIVVLGILAALAIPTFARVITRSKEATAVASAEAVGRQALALAAFTGTSALPGGADLALAISDTGGRVTLAADADPSDGSATVVVHDALKTPSEDVTVTLVFTATTVKGSVAGSSNPSTPTTPTPTPDPAPAPVPALAAPSSVTALALSDGTVEVSFAAAAGAVSYTVTPSTGTPVTTSSSPATVSGLTEGAPVTFTVTSSAPGRTGSVPSVPSSAVTPRLAHTSIMAWGYNRSGLLGIPGPGTSVATPTTASAFTSVRSVGTGKYHSCALVTDGSVSCIGSGSDGQVGLDTDSSAANQVLAPGTTTSVAVGSEHTCALVVDGTVKCWGSDMYGQLGRGSTSADRPYSSSTPATVPGLSGVRSLYAGLDTTFAILSDGTVKSWGYNGSGELGSGSASEYSATPGTVSGLTDVKSISGAVTNVYAVLSDGTVKAWGDGYYNQLGTGSRDVTRTPVIVTGLSGVTQVAAHGYGAFALKSDGTVSTWGSNSGSILGTDGPSVSPTPVTIPGLTDVKSVAASRNAGFALKSDGTLWSWGSVRNGEHGDGQLTSERRTPAQVPVTGVRNIVTGAQTQGVVVLK
jgi:prepilin-type N-terminal cleavage/methylation domain-containing protein